MNEIRQNSLFLRSVLWLAMVACGLWAGRCFAGVIEEEYVVHRWGMEDGLPEGAITSIQQFADGFLWLTTPRHVVRFDGVEFLSWQPGEDPSCTLRRLRGLMQDRHGFLWLYGENGVMRLEGTSWKAIELKTEMHPSSNTVWTVKTVDGELQQKPLVEVFCVKEGPDGTIWAATNVGVFRFDKSVFTLVKPNGAVSGIPFSSAALDASGILWLAGQSGLIRFDGRSYSPAPFPSESGRGVLSQVFNGAGETLWGKRLDGKLFRRLRPDGEWMELPPQGLRLVALMESRGEVWMGAAEGLNRWRQGTWHALVETGADSTTDIRCLKDNGDGSFWVGTGNGLLRLKPRTVRLTVPAGVEAKRPVTALLPAEEGLLWLGTSGKGVRYGSLKTSQPRFAEHPVLKTAEVSALLKPRQGGLLIGTRGNHLWFSRTNETIRQICVPDEGHAARSREITCLLETEGLRLWVGSRDGLLCASKYRWLEPVQELPVDTILSLCPDKDQGLWVGTQSSGLWQLTSEGRLRRAFRIKDGLPSDTVRLVRRETNGVLWVATPSGLVWIEPAQAGVSAGRAFVFTREHGLPSNDIRQLLDDGKGHLWLGLRQEICRASKQDFLDILLGKKQTLTLDVFAKQDGLSSELLSEGSPLTACMPDGTLLFATKAGVVVIDPTHLFEGQPEPRVFIEEVGVPGRGDRELLANRLFKSLRGVEGDLRFHAGTRDLVFRYVMPEQDIPERVSYRTLLEGYDKTWSGMTVERSATYTRLAPGAYRFRVMAFRAGGGWVEAARPLSVEIAPFFWETRWLKLLVALLALGGVGLASGGLVRRRARIRLERVRRAAEERERVLKYEQLVESERARIARDIHDDLGAGLTEIGVLGDLATHAAVKELDRVTRIQEMADKARRLVDTLDEIVWTVNPRNDTLQSFLYYAADYARDFLRPTNLRCRLDLPESAPHVHLGPDRRHALLMVLKEALNNMVKHANASEALLRIRLDGDVLRMQITDNGQGFVCGNERHDANGLRGMRERLESVQGRFAVESRPGAGTTLMIEMTF